MKPINFINPTADQNVHTLLVSCCFSCFDYEQTSDYIKELGYYLPEDQFRIFKSLLDMQLDLDIGSRQEEYRGDL